MRAAPYSWKAASCTVQGSNTGATEAGAGPAPVTGVADGAGAVDGGGVVAGDAAADFPDRYSSGVGQDGGSRTDCALSAAGSRRDKKAVRSECRRPECRMTMDVNDNASAGRCIPVRAMRELAVAGVLAEY